VDGALWTLLKKSHSQPPTPSKGAGHIMISYSWDQKDRMRELASHLKKYGLPIWLDVEQMEGSVLEKMADAVENCSLMILGLSSSYKESQACRTEAEYGYRLKKEVIFVMAEDGFVPNGWLGAMLGNKLWYNPWKDERGFEKVMAEIVKQSRRLFQPSFQREGQLRPPSPSPSKRSSLHTQAVAKQLEIPTDSEPLPPEMMKAEKIREWKINEVCRWLRSMGLEELLAPFTLHQVTGESLLAWAAMLRKGQSKEGEFAAVWNKLEIPHIGVELRLRRCLAFLPPEHQVLQTWENQRIVRWLEEKGLPEVSEVAKEGKWDGRVFHGLFLFVSEASSFSFSCDQLGITDSKVKLRLASAFETVLGE